MPTNLDLDDNLIEEVRALGHHKTKKAAVTAALDEYIRRLKFDPEWDYKAARKRKRS